jgi:hypothetical protein
MSVAIQLGSDTVDAATPVPLFEAHLAAVPAIVDGNI